MKIQQKNVRNVLGIAFLLMLMNISCKKKTDTPAESPGANESMDAKHCI